MNNSIMKYSVLGFVTLGLFAGCSAAERTVVNEPPAMPENVSSFQVEYGKLVPASITAFYWPDGMTEEQMREAARKVRAASLKIDEIVQKSTMIQKVEIPKLEGAFNAETCVEDWAAESGTIEGSSVAWVTAWKTLTPVNAVGPVSEEDPHYPDYVKYQEYVTKKKKLDGCQANQTQREGLLNWLKTASGEMDQAKLTIALTIDKDPTHPENMKTVSVNGTEIVLKDGADGTTADVTLKDFMLPGYSPSSQTADSPLKVYSASYIAGRKLLVFGVPELAPNPTPGPNAQPYVPTGAIIECALERGPDFLGMARFSGEMRLKKDGAMLRYGSITITGPLVAQ